ncbi:cytochrome c oxidase subunit II [Methylobacterium oxalidis]|uniref:cytochrome-c oxidase n=1 Tax=Methylobacterium oxalidis TaxID=944322 RepID=A0A512J6A3_9HYPH|nr:cytochrome c oxidase subunit II [Methylobacterium oxalidis]GEP05508.1 cytochrome c oxidase subunit 2 [Methylobacterium oxalidis]GJE31036.1 Cytochrome c oxidase subunit 2 [Methylobacterium oxalidis]GLS65599.1 cytochrome c oxidase subunit 2 [Methylobacterium oxalidis]
MLAWLMPEQASVQAPRVDAIFLALTAISGAIVLLVVGLVVAFSIRFRRGSKANRDALPSLVAREFEIGWTAATLFVFVFIFWWAASAEIRAYVAPKDAIEVHVVAKQWMWKTQSSNGAREINELHVPVGAPVRLILTSQDVIHSFYVPAFRLKRDALPGQQTETWFKATKTGTFHLLCTEYCGTDHARMLGRIVVMEPEDYARWLSAQPEGDDLAHAGERLFAERGCAGCHAPGSGVHAPGLAGLWGREIPLAGGRTATVDGAYVRDSILQPKRDVAAGYEPIMPSYDGLLSDGEIQELTAYIRALGAGPRASRTPGRPPLSSRVPGAARDRSPAMVPGAPVDDGPAPAGAATRP